MKNLSKFERFKILKYHYIKYLSFKFFTSMEAPRKCVHDCLSSIAQSINGKVDGSYTQMLWDVLYLIWTLDQDIFSRDLGGFLHMFPWSCSNARRMPIKVFLVGTDGWFMVASDDVWRWTAWVADRPVVIIELPGQPYGETCTTGFSDRHSRVSAAVNNLSLSTVSLKFLESIVKSSHMRPCVKVISSPFLERNNSISAVMTSERISCINCDGLSFRLRINLCCLDFCLRLLQRLTLVTFVLELVLSSVRGRGLLAIGLFLGDMPAWWSLYRSMGKCSPQQLQNFFAVRPVFSRVVIGITNSCDGMNEHEYIENINLPEGLNNYNSLIKS